MTYVLGTTAMTCAVGGDSSALWRWRLQPAVGVNPIVKIEFSTMRAIQQEAVAFFL
jgi:hypothetical protein